MVHAELTIINEQGIHLGPANKIGQFADRYELSDPFQDRIYGCECQKYY